MSEDDCRSPIGLDCCSCCLDLANGCDVSMSGSPAQGLGTTGGLPASPTSPSVSHFRQLRNQLMYQNLNRDKLNNIMRQDSLESVVRDPCFLLNEGICNSNIDQTMLSILLFFHRKIVIFIVTLGPLCSTGLETHHTSASLSMALTVMVAYPEVSAQRSIVSLCFENTVVENKQQQSSEKTVKGLLPLEQPLHLEAKMGQSQMRPTEIPPIGAMPPSPRTICAIRLAEPPHRFCCHYQHFSYPERAMSYSPPYSPSLFKRPDRR
ncbi:hypothetical protein D5F01_LYC15539 [Larimichthys crocea]|uniref:TSC22 domain family protein 3 n=1 Tax=Larimichthys crocea TaxID=215358 RepID=A0A6G0I368_LARCR|nr:hypothetical protein D5F01_LYC15539 [Larimichthys crocea]